MTVILRVISRYRSGLGSYEPGQDLHLDDETAARLIRDSPGSFKVAGSQPDPEPALDVTAMSTETETGLVAPDRRARGGHKR